MKKKHSLKLVIVSLAFLCWLIPILLMVAVMGYYVLSKQDDEQLERLAEQMAASSRICQERLDGAIANSRRISYDKTVQQKYEQYQRGELSYAALYSEVQYYLSVEYSRKKEAAFALIMMNGKEKDESFNVVNSSAGGSYQGILDFWEQDAELVKECAAKLDTAIGFVQNQGRLYLVRNMMNSRFKSWGVIVLCLNKDYCFETLLSGQENVGLSVDLSGENVLSQGISGKLPELTWDSTGRYQVEKGKIYLTFRIKSSDYTLKTLMIHSREELPVPLYGYEYVVIGMLACLLPLCLLMFVVFRRQVNQPIRTLMESAGEIEKGNLGYQISEEAANRERRLLQPVRDRATYVLDTTPFVSTNMLRSALEKLFGTNQMQTGLSVNVMSFGYKYGLPLEADLAMDVRFLPNPYYVAELKQLSGRDQPVQDYLDSFQVTGIFWTKLTDLLAFLLPQYAEEGKRTLTLAIGCTGGRHRSVALACKLADWVRRQGYTVSEYHRDVTRV